MSKSLLEWLPNTSHAMLAAQCDPERNGYLIPSETSYGGHT